MSKTYGNFTDFIDFSRASSGTYLGSDGLLKTAADNVPRVEYDASGNLKGLLIEEQRTNLITYSEDFTAWALTSCTVSPDTEMAPSNTLTADTVDFSLVGGFCRFVTGYNPSVGETFTNSIWVKAGTASSIRLGILFSGGGLGQTYEDFNLTSEWRRLDITATVPAGTPDKVRLRLVALELGTIHVWGAQIEQGSFPTSYIPTSGATATRSADIADIATANFGYNSKAGTVVVEATATRQLAGTMVNICDLGSGGSIHRMQVRFSGNTIQTIFATDGAADVILTNSAANPQLGETSIGGWSFKGPNTVVTHGNGTVSTPDTSHLVPSPRELRVGRLGTGEYLNGHIRSIKYIPRRNTNTQLQEFTS